MNEPLRNALREKRDSFPNNSGKDNGRRERVLVKVIGE